MIQTKTTDCSPDHCDRIDAEMSITVQQDESIGAGVVDDDDEIEGLRNSLKEMVQDQTVKPKLQCVMMDPSFSMVTVQSEDCKIVWEMASSRCFSPWASDASATSKAYSNQGSGNAGKIIFIMDEDKIIRRKKNTRGKLGDKFKRLPPKPITPEHLEGADERLEMAEVSVPNVSCQGTSENEGPTGQGEHKEKDLFCTVSKGSEILNIVPSRLPTVDEEGSSEMAENLCYLGQTVMVKSYPIREETGTDSHELNVFAEAKVIEEESSSTDKEPLKQNASASKLARRGGTGATLLAKTTPPDLPFEKTEIKLSNANEGAAATEYQEQPASKNPESHSLSSDIAGAHLNDIYRGAGCHDEPVSSAANKNISEEEEEHGTKEEEVPKSHKESSATLFGSEEMMLTANLISPGPPIIIDPSLLDEPRAMSSLYTDVCEETVEDKQKGEECSVVESTFSERSLRRHLSDTDDASGYLEKCILKDETHLVEGEPPKEGNEEDKLKMRPESTLELLGFITAIKDEALEENTKSDEITENVFVPYEENVETVTSENTRLDSEMFQPPTEVQECEHIQQEAVTCHENSKDKPEEMFVEETGSTENETTAENKELKSPVEKMTENDDSKEENLSKYVLSSIIAESGPHGAEMCIQKALMLDEDAKTDISQAVSEDTSESQLPHVISVDTTDLLIKGREEILQREVSSPHQGSDNGKGTGILEKTHEDIIYAENKEVQCPLESTAPHRPVAECDKGSKSVKQKGEMVNTSHLPPVRTVQAKEEEKVEKDSAEKERVPFSPLEDRPECFSEAFITEPPEMYRDQDDINVGATAHEIINQLEVCGPLETETEAIKEDKSREQSEHGFDSLEEPTTDSSSKETVEVMAETPLKEDKENDSKMSRFRFCVVCRCIISSLSTPFEEHKGHDVSTLDKAYEDVKGKLSQWISLLQGRSEKIEDLVSELEQAYNSIEVKCKTNARSLDEQNQEMVRAMVELYNEMSRSMTEKKRLRLEQLVTQIGTFREHIESAKEVLEREAKESSKDINESLSRALESTLSLEPMLENYTRGPEGRGQKVMKDILGVIQCFSAVPREPYLLVQEASSATCTSIAVFWRVSEEDVINCFHVNYIEEIDEAVSEVYKVTVKESYCTLEDLAPDKCYRVWVMASNYSGCSFPSEKLPFRTAPSVPEIIPEQCTVCWDSAIIRWRSTCPSAAETFTLEYCRQNACEGEGLRSISGIRDNEQSVLLQPNESYLFYIRAVNFAGASEQSEAALISTSGTRFHLLKDTASPGLVLSKDNMVSYPVEVFNRSTVPNVCQEILGEPLPPRGLHYWETTVEGSDGYRIGVVYHTTPQKGQLGENSSSWCIHCIPTSTSCRYELLHNSMQMSIITVEVPATIGTLLDYIHGCLSFFNAQSGQLLGSCCHRFSEPCHPVLVLERPGTLALHPVMEVPNFAISMKTPIHLC